MILEIVEFQRSKWKWRLIDAKGRTAAESVIPYATYRRAAGAFYEVADGMCANLIHYNGQNIWIFNDYEDHRMTSREFVAAVWKLYRQPMVALAR